MKLFLIFRRLVLIVCISLAFASTNKAQKSTSVNPQEFFQYVPGSDRNLFDYEELISYLKKLDESSARVEMREIGKSPMGKPMYTVFISSEENIKKLDELGEINRKLALDADLKADQVEMLIKKGKVFMMATLSMHSTEVGPSQSLPLIAYELATTKDPAKIKWLDNVVYMVVPNMNPDGMDMIVNHYRKYKGTKYEDSSMPGVYHKYIGHDNNRDFVTLTQSDTKAISEITSKTWLPQVVVDKHQMGGTSVRYFVPQAHDPIAENVDEGLWNWSGLFGSGMIKDLTKEGCAGVAQQYLFDLYWAGASKTCLWKNVISFLTEAASCNLATPVYVEPSELTVTGKGLAEYKKSANMPLLWPGGWWHLSDIVKMEIVSTNSILNTCSVNKEEILKFRNDLCRKEVLKGKTQAPYYYILPVEQHDQSEWMELSRLLTEHGVNVYKLNKKTVLNGVVYEPGAFVVPLSQPFRPFIKEVMEVQEYPVRHFNIGGEIIKPYDVTSWSLPLHKGVSCEEIKVRNEELENNLTAWKPGDEMTNDSGSTTSVLVNINNNASYKAAFIASAAGLKVQRLAEDIEVEKIRVKKGSFLISSNGSGNSKSLNEIIKSSNNLSILVKDTKAFKLVDFAVPRIGVVESWFDDVDAGWTRYVLDDYKIQFKVLRPADFEKAELENEYDVLVFPSINADNLMKGRSASAYPPGFTKGIGEKGFEKILKFLENGGKIISWGESTGMFMGTLKIKNAEETEEFILPVQDISSALKSKGLYCPGSFVNINLRTDHPLTLGMQDQIGVFYRGQPVFTTKEPQFDMDRRVIATFPEKDVLKSGYIENGELLGNKSAMVWLKKGKGQVVLFAFNPQFRASTPVSYKLLFNALLLKEAEGF